MTKIIFYTLMHAIGETFLRRIWHLMPIYKSLLNKQAIYICALETNGKISATEAYDRIKDLWRQLKESKKQLLDDR